MDYSPEQVRDILKITSKQRIPDFDRTRKGILRVLAGTGKAHRDDGRATAFVEANLEPEEKGMKRIHDVIRIMEDWKEITRDRKGRRVYTITLTDWGFATVKDLGIPSGAMTLVNDPPKVKRRKKSEVPKEPEPVQEEPVDAEALAVHFFNKVMAHLTADAGVHTELNALRTQLNAKNEEVKKWMNQVEADQRTIETLKSRLEELSSELERERMAKRGAPPTRRESNLGTSAKITADAKAAMERIMKEGR